MKLSKGDKVANNPEQQSDHVPNEGKRQGRLPRTFDEEAFQALVKKQLEDARKNRLPCIVVETIHDEC
jgi:hypothetical protein